MNLERSGLSYCSAAKCFKMALTLRHSKSHDILRMIQDNVHSVQFLKLHLTLIRVTGESRLNNAAFVPFLWIVDGNSQKRKMRDKERRVRERWRESKRAEHVGNLLQCRPPPTYLT